MSYIPIQSCSSYSNRLSFYRKAEPPVNISPRIRPDVGKNISIMYFWSIFFLSDSYLCQIVKNFSELWVCMDVQVFWVRIATCLSVFAPGRCCSHFSSILWPHYQTAQGLLETMRCASVVCLLKAKTKESLSAPSKYRVSLICNFP